MKSRVNKRITLLLTGAACVLFCTATASADIVTFWKTDTCPNFGGTKFAITSEVGRMESLMYKAGANPDTDLIGAGGLHCALDSSPRATTPENDKAPFSTNVDVVDRIDNFTETWRCVVCQYENKINIPTISLLGTIILMAGLLTAAAYRIGKNQKREASA